MLDNVFQKSNAHSEALKEEEVKIIKFAKRHLKGIHHISSRTSYAVRRYAFDIIDPVAAESYRNMKTKTMLNIITEVRKGTTCETEFDEGKFIISVPRKDKEILWLGDGIEYLNNLPKKEGELIAYVGEKESGKPAIANFIDIPHWIIGGISGSGKTVCQYNMILSMLSRYSPEELEIYIADHKGELTFFDDVKHVKNQANKIHEMIDLFSEVNAILEERKVILKGTNVLAYNKKHETKFPQIILFFDEADTILKEKANEYDKKTVNKIRSYVTKFAAEARYAGIHLVIGTQKPTGTNIATTIKSNIGGRIALKVANRTDSVVIINEAGAEKLLGKGDAYMLTDLGGKERIQAAYTTEEERQNALKIIREAY